MGFARLTAATLILWIDLLLLGHFDCFGIRVNQWQVQMPLVVFFKRDVSFDESDNVSHVIALVTFIHHGNGHALSSCTSSSSNSVNVRFADVGDFEVDHVANSFDVNSPCSDVGGHEDANLAFSESIHGLVSLRLALVPMDCFASNVVFSQVTHHFVCAVFGSGKHQCSLHISSIEQMHKKVSFGALADKHHLLIYGFSCTADAGNFNTNWIG